MTVRDSVRALTDLGFTNLEAEIYAFLLQESPATGYRIAQAIGKPAANVYKAVQTLEQKGAVIVEDGSSRMCRAVSSDELLSRLGREFEAKRVSALQSLRGLNHASSDDRIYQLRSKEQVLQRALEMVVSSKQILLGIIPGSMVDTLAEDLLHAAARGVDIALFSDRAVRIEGIEVFVEDVKARARPTLELVVDGEQTLTSVFDASGGLLHAIWSRSAMLAVTHHEGLAAQMSFANLSARVEEGAGQKRLTRAVSAHRPSSATIGFARLKT